MPFVNLTRATFRKAELGFLGVAVKTFKHTPLLKGEADSLGLFFKTLKVNSKAGDLVRFKVLFLPFLTS